MVDLEVDSDISSTKDSLSDFSEANDMALFDLDSHDGPCDQGAMCSEVSKLGQYDRFGDTRRSSPARGLFFYSMAELSSMALEIHNTGPTESERNGSADVQTGSHRKVSDKWYEKA